MDSFFCFFSRLNRTNLALELLLIEDFRESDVVLPDFSKDDVSLHHGVWGWRAHLKEDYPQAVDIYFLQRYRE